MKFASRFRVSHALLAAALFVALSGVSYAAIELSARSVGTKHLKGNAVISEKVRDGSLKAEDFVAGELAGHLDGEGATGATGAMGGPGSPGPQGLQGEAGPIGSDGEQGEPGLLGPAGDEGPDGAQGPEGSRGATGAAGIDGYTVLSGRAELESSRQHMTISGSGEGEGVGTMLPHDSPVMITDFQVVLHEAPGIGAMRDFRLVVNNVGKPGVVLHCSISGTAKTCHNSEEKIVGVQDSAPILSINTGANAGTPADTGAMASLKLTPVPD